MVFKVVPNQQLFDRFRQMCDKIGEVPSYGVGSSPGNRQRRFHGTTMKCLPSFKASGNLCNDPGCPACQIIKTNFRLDKLSTGSGNSGHYGAGLYSTSMPATAEGYGQRGLNVVLVVNVAVGSCELTSSTTSSGLSGQTHSRVVNKATGVDELVVFNEDQMLPQFLLLL